MGKNNRPKTTVTRSICFDAELFPIMESTRKTLRVSRSRFLTMVLEHNFGIISHPEVAAFATSLTKELKRKVGIAP